MRSQSAPAAPRFDQLHHAAERFSSLVHDALRPVAEVARADARVRATVALLAVMASAALALAPARTPPAEAAREATPTPARHVAVADATRPVKFVGAAPRTGNCAEQVWPYIEQRCLTRPADAPKSAPATSVGKPAAATAASGRTTMGAAPVDPAAPPQLVVPDSAHKLRVATVHLSLAPAARQRFGASEPDDLPVPPGAGRGDGVSRWADEDESWSDRAMERPFLAEPRRRMGRRAYRHGRIWGRGRVFGFPF